MESGSLVNLIGAGGSVLMIVVLVVGFLIFLAPLAIWGHVARLRKLVQKQTDLAEHMSETLEQIARVRLK
jgi:ABC-type bacteriocin/lantibiotic exporter with double-glycine peptidase domain